MEYIKNGYKPLYLFKAYVIEPLINDVSPPRKKKGRGKFDVKKKIFIPKMLRPD